MSRSLLVYLGASLAVLEVVDAVTEHVGLPDWVFSGTLMLLAIGLPVVVATAIVQSAPGSAVGSGSSDVSPEAAVRPRVGTGSAERNLQPADPKALARRWLTWPRAIAAGVVAFTLLGLSVTGYTVMREEGIGPLGSLLGAGVLRPQELIIVADFENLTADSLLGAVVADALRTDLRQSPVVTVMGPERVVNVLARMEEAGNAKLDLALAREVAVREGAGAVLGGEVVKVGSGYVLSAQLVSAATGEVVAAFRETAEGPDGIIQAIDDLSTKIRKRIGESHKALQRHAPLEQVTTSSLEALRKYTQAERVIYKEGDEIRGIALLEEALALDSTFASAWAELGTAYANRGEERARAVQALTKAYEYRDRLTEQERYSMLGVYYMSVTAELEKAIAAYRTLLAAHPDDDDALHNLAVLHGRLRDFAQAESLFRRSIEVDSSFAITYQLLATMQYAQGKVADAETTLARMREKVPGHYRVALTTSALASARGDYAAAEAEIRTLRDSRSASRLWRANTSAVLARFARLRGRLAEAEASLRDAMAADAERGLPAEYLRGAINLARLNVELRRDPQRALDDLESALERYPLDPIDPLDRPYLELAELQALSGRTFWAKALLARYEADVEPELRRTQGPRVNHLRGLIALAEKRPAEAIARLTAWDAGIECPICALPDLGRAYELAGEPDSAIALYERYLVTPWLWRLEHDAYHLADVYERLGRLFEARGDGRTAADYYSRLIALWNTADPELQPRVASAAGR